MIEGLYQLLNDTPARERRKYLISKMEELGRNGFGCENCKGGWCCTFEFNSMRVTPVEAMDMYLWLEKNNRLDQDLIEHLKSTQKKYRLDKEIYVGRGNSFRRTYTCPFFTESAQGCSLSRSHKPYGCLAFNAQKPAVTEAGFCGSDQKLLEQQVTRNQDDKINQLLRQRLNLSWDKKDIPSALLEINDQLKNL